MNSARTEKKKRGPKVKADLSNVRVSFKPTHDVWSVLGKYQKKGYYRSAIINKAIIFAEQEGIL